jgi:hypothetical protein
MPGRKSAASPELRVEWKPANQTQSVGHLRVNGKLLVSDKSYAASPIIQPIPPSAQYEVEWNIAVEGRTDGIAICVVTANGTASAGAGSNLKRGESFSGTKLVDSP